MQPDVCIVGGFLGAGKTTFLREMAKFMTTRGKKAGLITNDQASALVDTAFLRQENGHAVEVSGSCFCCNFNGFIEAASRLSQAGMDVILAEPVGSCTDLSATIMQPLKENHRHAFRTRPLSVFADPHRLENLLDGKPRDMHPGATYIMVKQLEEADLIVVAKADLLSPPDAQRLMEKTAIRFPDKPVLFLSAQTGQGFEEWVDAVFSTQVAGATITEVDYDIYAEGEAVLGWLNMAVRLEKAGADWNGFAGDFLHALATAFNVRNLPVAHVKLMVEAGGASILGHITANRSVPQLRNAAGRGNSATLTVNARVETSPETLSDMMESVLHHQCAKAALDCHVTSLNCLRPGRPTPTYRYTDVVT